MNKRKTSCDLSKLLVATLFRLETEIQEAMLRPERRVPTKSTVSSQDTLFPENHASALHKVIHESVEEEPEWNAVEEGGSSCSNFSALIE
ncbi:hypothetical protein POTOM_020322 [Populus tomentosa]|uniref:Uncharacterized protein n=1 Tax=Populus tomentosa TaxID=118781 RepID=A0A8X7ZLE5_POPTO|nr:hypothetical protein POTOM_020322 [Populus tomentosa]